MSISSVPIGDVCTVVGGGTPARDVPQYYGGDIPWVTPKDMKKWEIRDAQVKITRVGLDNSATRLVPANSVLVVVRSGVLKHTVPVAISRTQVAINQDMKAFICSGHVDPDYLARFIKARSSEILQWVRATTADNFPVEKLKQLRMSLPALPEQRRIAEILDKADALRAKRRAALAQLDTLTQSIFLDMFGDPATNPKRWTKKPLGELVSEFRYGTSNKSATDGKPALRIPNVVGGVIDPSDLKLVPVDDAEFARLRLRNGDLLFVRTNGNQDSVGRCAVFDSKTVASTGFSGDDFIFASYLIRARLIPDVIEPTFLGEYFLGSEGRRQLRARSKTSAGQFNINTESLAAIPTPIPTKALQQEFARRRASIQSAMSPQHSSQAELHALFNALQHRAFNGEL